MSSDQYHSRYAYPQEAWPADPNLYPNYAQGSYLGDTTTPYHLGYLPYPSNQDSQSYGSWYHNANTSVASPSVEKHAQLVEDFLQNISSRPSKVKAELREKRQSFSSEDELKNKSNQESKKKIRSKKRSSIPGKQVRSPASKERSRSTSSRRSYGSSSERISQDSSKSKKPRLRKDEYKQKLTELKRSHEEDFRQYKKNPESHPKYHHEKKFWLSYMKDSSSNLPPNILEKEWKRFWEKLLQETLKHNWKEKKKYLSKKYSRSSSSSSSSSSPSSLSSSPSLSPEKRKKGSTRKKSEGTMKKEKKDSSLSPTNPEDSLSKGRDAEHHHHQEEKTNGKCVPTSAGSKEQLTNASNPDGDIKEPHAKVSRGSSETLESYKKDNKIPKPDTDLQEILGGKSTQEDYALNSSSRGSPPSKLAPSELKLSEEAYQVVKTLKQLGSKLGLYENAVSQLFLQFSSERKKGKNLCDFIDKDAQMFFSVVRSKIESCLVIDDITLIQKAILQETLENLTTFMKNLEDSRGSIKLDVEGIARAAKRKSCYETIQFLKDVLSQKEVELTNERLMDLYLATTSFQARSASGEDLPSETVFTIHMHERKASTIPTDNSSVATRKEQSPSKSPPELKKEERKPNPEKTQPKHKKIAKFSMKVKKQGVSSVLQNVKSKSASQVFVEHSNFLDE